MAGQGSAGNVLAALCSFFIPGLGQLLQGRLLMAIVQSGGDPLVCLARMDHPSLVDPRCRSFQAREIIHPRINTDRHEWMVILSICLHSPATPKRAKAGVHSWLDESAIPSRAI
jgi:hypothetical protein